MLRLSEFLKAVGCHLPPFNLPLTKAMASAKFQEVKLQQISNPPKLVSPYPPILPTPPDFTVTKPVTTIGDHLSSTLTTHNTHISNTPSQPKQTVQRLTQAQIQARREKCLCFYCDDNILLVINVELQCMFLMFLLLM